MNTLRKKGISGMKKIMLWMLLVAVSSSVSPGAISDAEMLKMANRGNAEAQRIMGRRLFYGLNGTPVKRKIAILWFKKAAAQGDAQALYFLGGLYESGTNVKQDYEEAEDYYRRAAEKGHKKAAKKLASAPFAKKKDEGSESGKSVTAKGRTEKPEADEKTSVAANDANENTEADDAADSDEKKAVASDAPAENKQEQEKPVAAREQEKEPEFISLGDARKRPMFPYCCGWETLSGECHFEDSTCSAVIIEDGRRFAVADIKEMEIETIQLAKLHARDAVGVLASKNWRTFGDIVKMYDFCGDPLVLCYLNAAAQWGNDLFAVRMSISEDKTRMNLRDELFDDPKVKETVRENIRKLQNIKIDTSVAPK